MERFDYAVLNNDSMVGNLVEAFKKAAPSMVNEISISIVRRIIKNMELSKTLDSEEK